MYFHIRLSGVSSFDIGLHDMRLGLCTGVAVKTEGRYTMEVRGGAEAWRSRRRFAVLIEMVELRSVQ